MLTVDPYPYQDEAIDMVLDLGYGLIAYEMGLGKTMVGIAVAEELLDEPAINFALIVVPSGLKYQWAQSIAKFTDVAKTTKKVKKGVIEIPTPEYCVVVDGDPKKRKAQYRFIEENWPPYVIVSYEQVVNDFRSIKNLGAELVVLDEATAIKGFKAQRSKKIKELDPEFAVALSGTPLENNPEEVYSIMEFVCPGYLGTFQTFDQKYIVRNRFGGVVRYRNLDILHRKLSKVMSRKTRLDPDVAPYMPDVDHREEYVFLPKKTQTLYNKVAKLLVKELSEMQITSTFDVAAYYSGEGGQDMSQQGRIMAKLLALQMLCNDPELLRSSAQRYVDTDGEDGSAFAFQLADEGLLDDLEDSAKIAAVMEDVERILTSHPDNKIIIFSFFKDMVFLLQSLTEDMGIRSVVYTGNQNAAAKAEAQALFKTDPDVRLFIASDAGAFGVDLPEANYLMNVDLVDSAGKMDQRNARHVRAGSKHKKVYVLNYLVDGSVEERKFARLNFKRRVSRAVVDGRHRTEDGVIENDVASLTEFLGEFADEGSAA